MTELDSGVCLAELEFLMGKTGIKARVFSEVLVAVLSDLANG